MSIGVTGEPWDPHIRGPVACVSGGFFLEGSTVTAQFNFTEGEPIPPDGFEVQSVAFGGEFQTVTYKVTKPNVRRADDLFFGHRAFDRYSDELQAFYAYRQQIIDKLRTRRDPR